MPGQRDPEKKMIGLWVKGDLKKQLEELAKEENRTTANMLETILKKALQERSSNSSKKRRT